jgi:hypothetical protein
VDQGTLQRARGGLTRLFFELWTFFKRRRRHEDMDDITIVCFACVAFTHNGKNLPNISDCTTSEVEKLAALAQRIRISVIRSIFGSVSGLIGGWNRALQKMGRS